MTDIIPNELASYDELWDMCIDRCKTQPGCTGSVDHSAKGFTLLFGPKVYLRYEVDRESGTITCINNMTPPELRATEDRFCAVFHKRPLVVEAFAVAQDGPEQGVRRTGPYIQFGLHQMVNSAIMSLRPQDFDGLRVSPWDFQRCRDM